MLGKIIRAMALRRKTTTKAKEVCELFGDNCQKLHSHFFNLVDKFCFGEEDESGEVVSKGTDFSSITPEQRKEMSELSSVVYNYLD